MFVKLSSDVVINTNYITAIVPFEGKVINSSGEPVKYNVCMVDGHQWYMTEADYCEISHHV